jgi:hypothetical protein
MMAKIRLRFNKVFRLLLVFSPYSGKPFRCRRFLNRASREASWRGGVAGYLKIPIRLEADSDFTSTGTLFSNPFQREGWWFFGYRPIYQ